MEEVGGGVETGRKRRREKYIVGIGVGGWKKMRGKEGGVGRGEREEEEGREGRREGERERERT